MSAPLHPGPEYMRASEWTALRTRRRRRRLALGSVLGAVAALGAVWWVKAPALRISAELRAAVRVLEEVRNSHLACYRIGPEGVRTVVWQEWNVGDLSRFDGERSGAMQLRSAVSNLAWDPETHTLGEHRHSERGVEGRRIVARLLREAAGAANIERLPNREGVGRSLRRYRFEQGRERFLIWIEEGSARPVGCLVELRTTDGWVPTHEFAIDLGSPVPAGMLVWMPPDDAGRIDLTDGTGASLEPREVLRELPIGPRDAIRVGPVDVNRDGTLFVVVHSLSQVRPYVTDDRGMLYFRRDDARTWPDLPAAEHLFVPLEPDDGRFEPRTVTVHFPAGNTGPAGFPPRDLASFEIRFDGPTCAVVPAHRQTSLRADYEALYAAEATRGEHLARVTRLPNGQPVDALATPALVPNDRMSRATVDQQDLASAARAYRRALALHRESGVYSGPTPATVWFRLYELMQSFGREEDAWRALWSAEAALEEGRREPLASEIRLTFRSWKKP